MSRLAFHILRIGMGITFIWLGIAIWTEPLVWGSFIAPWAERLIPGDLQSFMRTTAAFDILIGAWFLVGFRIWIPALLGALHIFGVLVTTTTGWGNVIIRDIGLLSASVALFVQSKFE